MYPTNIQKVKLLRKDFKVRKVQASTPMLKDNSLDSEGDFDDYLNST